MSGHSKWSTIKRKKGAADAKRGALFTKLANAITVAAKEGGGDPETNFSLRLTIDKARGGNMPTANIDRAIKRGTGDLAGEKAPEQVTYEAYGPGGVAILVQCLTDNRNRTVSEVRSHVTKRGGSLADAGSVAYLFSQRGIITVDPKDADPDEVMLAAIEAGAADTEQSDDGLVEIETEKTGFQSVKEALESAGYEIASAGLEQVATTQVPVTDSKIAGTIVELVTELEELDDVLAVATNADIDPDAIGG